jgi:negative regulator of sigma E activity
MATQNKEELQDRVPADFSARFQEQLDHEFTRKRIIAVVDDYVSNVAFMKKVREYAGEEYDNRILRSARFWGATVGSAVITALVSSLVTLLVTGRLK